MNCVIYARVSTDKQAEKELSIPAQFQAMRQFAHDRRWIVLEEFVEAGASARTAERPALRRLLARSRNSEPTKVNAVLVHKLDRLTRNLADHVAIRAQLRHCNVTLASATESLEDSVSGQLVEHILAAMAEFYSANLSEEVKKGMRQKVLQGGWPHHPPRGYRIVGHDPSRLVIDDVQGPLVRKAFDYCLADYRGLIDLRIRLGSAGLLTRNGKPVSNAYLGQLLRNPFYTGMMRWKGEVYPANHPPIVSPAAFEQVQRILREHSKRVVRSKARFLLTGLAYCATCGLLVGAERHSRWQYYRCRGSFKSFDRCEPRYARVTRTHEELEQILRGTVPSASERAELVRTVSRLSQEHIESEASRQAGIRSQLAAVHRREAHLTRVFTQGLLTAGDIFKLLTMEEQRLWLEILFERLEVDAMGLRYTLRTRQHPAAA